MKRVKKELAVAREDKKNNRNICGRKGKKELAVASDWNNGVDLEKNKICCRIVPTRQGLRTDPSLVRRRECGSLYGNETERDPLKDIASHLPAASTHSDKGE
jgi:hypothetical protein